MLDPIMLSEITQRPMFDTMRVFRVEQFIERYTNYLREGDGFTSHFASHWWQETYDLVHRAVPVDPNVCLSVLRQRHALYGGRSLVLGGPIGIVVRSLDKLCRIEHMTKNNIPDPKDDDKLLDNWADLYNYAILGSLLVRGGVTCVA